MIQRCTNPKINAYKYYGARGITVSDEFLDFPTFIAYMGMRPSSKMSIERIDNSKGYERGNIKWADRDEQARNTRRTRKLEFRGETKCLTDWAAAFGIDRNTFHCRLGRGLDMETALTLPVRSH